MFLKIFVGGRPYARGFWSLSRLGNVAFCAAEIRSCAELPARGGGGERRKRSRFATGLQSGGSLGNAEAFAALPRNTESWGALLWESKRASRRRHDDGMAAGGNVRLFVP